MLLPQHIIIVVVCILTPLLVLYLTFKSRILRHVGPIILTYIIGCLLGLTGLMPSDEASRSLLTIVASASIPFAIPLMLFSSDLRSWRSLAPSFVKSLLFGILGCVLAIYVGFLLYGQSDPALFSSIGGMLTGLYTGGTANLASLKVALNVDDMVYLQIHAYDIAASALYLIIVIVFGKRILLLIMPDFHGSKSHLTPLTIDSHDSELFLGIFSRPNRPHLIRSLLMSVLVILVGAGVALLVPHDMFQSVFILSISLLAILASTVRTVRETKRTFELGTFFILVFSMAVSSQVNLDMLTNVRLDYFMFTLVVTLGGPFFHFLLCSIFRIDTDTALVTSISLICSPPFVPVMASSLNNKAVVGPGIAVGLIGYAIGTYLGFTVAYILT